MECHVVAARPLLAPFGWTSLMPRASVDASGIRPCFGAQHTT